MNSRYLMAVSLAALSTLLLRPARAQNDQDKMFLTHASQSDFNEIKLSQLAAQNASSPEVKEFANKMVTGHTNLEQQMKPFADQWGITPATSLDSQHQTLYDKLSGLNGKQFDKEYMRAMDKDHHMALSDFEAEHETTKLPAFKQAVAQGEKVVAQHTKMADHLAGKFGVRATDNVDGGDQPM